MTVVVDIAVAGLTHLPTKKALQNWAKAAMDAARPGAGDITIRVVDRAEIQQLNRDFRHQDKPTNVLSFPFDMPEGLEGVAPILGDLAICAEVVAHEAKEQGKPLTAHWAHMVVHGTLHLLGYDHMTDDEAETMEKFEIAILKQLGFDNPY
jgi:probable rRNA maturation factor